MTATPATLLLTACALLLNACAGQQAKPSTPVTPTAPLVSLYDSQLVDPVTGATLTPAELAGRLHRADVVMVGEYHGHNGAHLLQSRLQVALQRLRPQQILSLEQFNADHHNDLERYLAGETGEEALIADADAWSNYKASYRPLVEFARHRNLPVVAANAPAQLVRCVGRQGRDYLDRLSPEQRTHVPEQPFFGTPAYRERFLAAMGGGNHGDDAGSGQHNSYLAQLLRDNTMANRILQALAEHPEHQVLHLTGSFHSEYRQGTVAALKQRRPDLDILVISPVTLAAAGASPDPDEHLGKGDYLYYLLPLPPRYRDDERQRQALRAQFREAAGITCD